MGITINEENYDTYKKIFKIISEHLYGGLAAMLPSNADPMSMLNTWESQSKALARKALRVGLNDSLSGLKYQSPSKIDEVNEALQREGLPSIYILLGEMKDTIKKVLKARGIRTLEQYYIVKEFLSDTSSDISAGERENLSVCMVNFELKK